jgi:hypothetical protein
MAALLWIIAVVLVIAGIIQLLQGQAILGVVLIVVGLLVGPGGVSIFAMGPGALVAGAWPVGRTSGGHLAPVARAGQVTGSSRGRPSLGHPSTGG